MKSIYFFFLGLTLTLFACHTSKKASTATTPKVENSVLTIASVLLKMQGNNLDFEHMNGDAGVDYKGQPMNIAVSSMVRWRRDSVIWMNVRKLGFTVARIQVTRDSVFVVNYLQGNYVAKNLSYIEKTFGVPLDFSILQDILLGNPIFLTEKDKLTFEKSVDGDVVLRGKDQRWKATYKLNATDFTVKEMLFEEPGTNRLLKICYKNYGKVRMPNGSQKNFSYLRTIDMESSQTGKVNVVLEVDAESLEINVPKNIKFEIPNHYERVD